MKDLNELKETFSFVPDWMDRYGVIIELGKELPPAADGLHDEANIVRGCMSKVWVRTSVEDGTMQFEGDSDAAIVRGLIAVIFLALRGMTPAQVAAYDVAAEFEALGLSSNLSPNRRNGFASMIGVIRSAAAAAAA